MTPAGNETEYAFWTNEDNSFRINYSLPLFHEIDFQVNEGYRRIPHGGVEVGGILYGTADVSSVSIEAFLPIECEHATGPSFNLSERDLSKLAATLLTNPGGEEFKGFVPLGWFIAHTRSPLRMTEREMQLFDQFFPGPAKITLLIKPERFQATRFGFIVRQAGRSLVTDVSNSAIILPLPGRAGSSSKGLTASIPAPAAKPAPSEKKPEDQSPKAAKPVEPPAAPESKKEVPLVSIPSPEPKPEPVLALPPVLPPVEEIKKRRSQKDRGSILQEKEDSAAGGGSVTRPLAGTRETSHPRLFWVLAVAALLGCVVGYWAYLQLPSAEISLRVQKHGSNLLIQWPPDQTRNVGYAALRVDDGGAMLLTEEQKNSGQIDIRQTSGNMKIELIVQRWIRTSRGIMRFISLSALPQQPKTAPAEGR